VHAASIADLLHMPRVVIPPVAATYSAFGMFAMDLGRNYARSYISRAKDLDLARVNTLYSEMEREAVDAFAEMDVDASDITFARTADLRYLGQFHEVEVDVPAGELDAAAIERAIENFHARHEQLYTFNMPWQTIEFLTFRLRATTPKAAFELRRIEDATEDAEGAIKRRRTVWWDGAAQDTPVYDGAQLRAGHRFPGPAIVEETTTTVVVPPRYVLEVDPYRNYVMTRTAAGQDEPESRFAEAIGGRAG
jgi:N-methylhydantoinase A